FQRLGGRLFIHPDVQFICATNRDLKQLVKAGKFREDLLYRLDRLSFVLPALNQRKEDIPLLSGYFLLRSKIQYQVDTVISEAMLERLKAHAWPGNVRELCNAIVKWVLDAKHEAAVCALERSASLPDKLRLFEAVLINECLQRHTNKSKAAQALGIPLSTLRSKLKKMDLCAAMDPQLLDPPGNGDGLSFTEKVNMYEASLINESLKRCATQSEAARLLGIPLSTLRSKLKKYEPDRMYEN
ncbi:MAG: hypothetical protein C4519_03435, partial [Desulfobacteraceae bacterium]